jgi:hypothetical protein
LLKEKISNEDRYDIIKAEQQLTFATVVNPGEVTLYEHKDCEIIEKDPFSKYVGMCCGIWHSLRMIWGARWKTWQR